ncbi:hypothetical protein ACJROX_06750 [Pseudalkalibacillus sp. A8]|uniref:hypothetical protein n=1 Tax=Pseudalkalibacillus sp. A8 TaxID=3382641 RepID=UPI0038B5FEA6
METRKLHYLIACISYPITIIHFIFGNYTNEKLISGIAFFTVATLIYVGFTYLFFKSETGKRVVVSGLLLASIVFIFLAFQTV